MDLVCLDEDWYAIDLKAGDRMTVNLFFQHSEGNLNLGLFNKQGYLNVYSESLTDNEHASIEIVDTGMFYILVYKLDGVNSYNLTIDITTGSATNATDTTDTTDTDMDEPLTHGDISSFPGFTLTSFVILGMAALILRKRH